MLFKRCGHKLLLPTKRITVRRALCAPADGRDARLFLFLLQQDIANTGERFWHAALLSTQLCLSLFDCVHTGPTDLINSHSASLCSFSSRLGNTRYDNLTVTLQHDVANEGNFRTLLARGSPYMTFEFAGATPRIKANGDILEVWRDVVWFGAIWRDVVHARRNLMVCAMRYTCGVTHGAVYELMRCDMVW